MSKSDRAYFWVRERRPAQSSTKAVRNFSLACTKVKINELLRLCYKYIKNNKRRTWASPDFLWVCAGRWWSNNIHVRAVKPVGLHEKEKRRSVGRPPKPRPRELWAQHEIKFSSPCAQGIIYSLLVYRPQRKSASNWFHCMVTAELEFKRWKKRPPALCHSRRRESRTQYTISNNMAKHSSVYD